MAFEVDGGEFSGVPPWSIEVIAEASDRPIVFCGSRKRHAREQVERQSVSQPQALHRCSNPSRAWNSNNSSTGLAISDRLRSLRGRRFWRLPDTGYPVSGGWHPWWSLQIGSP